MLRGELPGAPLPPGAGPATPIVELLGSTDLVTSKGEARRLIQQGGLYVNGQRVPSATSPIGTPLAGGYYWVRSGKKVQYLLDPPLTGR